LGFCSIGGQWNAYLANPDGNLVTPDNPDGNICTSRSSTPRR
jgi:hypothetical protein